MKMKNFALVAASLAPALALAEEGAAAAHASSSGMWAAGIGMGLASAVVGYSQSRAAVAALESIGRNPAATDKLFTPLILSLALMESLVLFAFVVTFKLAGGF